MDYPRLAVTITDLADLHFTAHGLESERVEMFAGININAKVNKYENARNVSSIGKWNTVVNFRRTDSFGRFPLSRSRLITDRVRVCHSSQFLLAS